MRDYLVFFAATFPLVACGMPRTGEPNGPDVANASQNDAAAPERPGAKGNFNVEPVMMKPSYMEIDGVKLFPGSNFTAVNVQGNDVTIGFSAPATVAVVKAYYAKRFGEEGVTFTPSADGFTGRTRDGGDFSLSFADSDGSAAVVMKIHDRK